MIGFTNDEGWQFQVFIQPPRPENRDLYVVASKEGEIPRVVPFSTLGNDGPNRARVAVLLYLASCASGFILRWASDGIVRTHEREALHFLTDLDFYHVEDGRISLTYAGVPFCVQKVRRSGVLRLELVVTSPENSREIHMLYQDPRDCYATLYGLLCMLRSGYVKRGEG